MITLITGSPGAGKTLNTLKLVVDEQSNDRPIYYAGIKELTIPGWKEISYDQARDWQSFEDGACFVIDEADLFAGNTPAERKTVPKYVSELARHRHRGMDFYFITQNPTRIHFDLRPHINRHQHYERQFQRASARRLEWQHGVDDPLRDRDARSKAIVTRVNYPKDYYSKYKSAEVHTYKPKIPRKMYVVFALMCLAGFLMYNLLHRVTSTPEEILSSDPDQEKSSSPLDFSFADNVSVDDAKTPEEWIIEQTPRFADIPWSAPMYDELTVAKDYPRPQCIFNHSTAECSCYTQQATRLVISYDNCRTIVNEGYWDPYKEPGEGVARRQAQAIARAEPPPEQVQNQGPRIAYVNHTPSGSATRPLRRSRSSQPTQSTNQPGGAYRNPVRTQPVQEQFAPMGSRPLTQEQIDAISTGLDRR